MTFTDGIGLTATHGTDRAGAEGTGGKDQTDHLQQYRLAPSDSSLKISHRTSANQQYLELAESPTSSSTTPPAEAPEKRELLLGQPTYFAQPVYGTDSNSIAQSVEKYGSKLDYHQKQNLDDMISSTSLGQTDKLQEAFKNSTSETRNAYAHVLSGELGLEVSLFNKENGGYDLSVFLDSSKIDISQDKPWSPVIVSTDRQPVNEAVDALSDSAAKYRKEIGQTR